jgi:hypothetical protein
MLTIALETARLIVTVTALATLFFQNSQLVFNSGAE